MIEHLALPWAHAYHRLLANIEWLHRVDKEDRGKPLNERVLSLGKTQFIAQHALQNMLVELDRMKFQPDLQVKARRLWSRLVDENARTWTAESVLDALTDINGEIQRELGKHRFAYLGVGVDEYFENDHLFGSEVFEKFKSARQDIKDAGNCFATGLYTASVFHLMRVAEHGLRVIARRLKVQITDKKKRIPLSYGDWTKVIEAIRNKITESRSLVGAQKQTRLDFYSDLAGKCEYLRDIYRNNVSHTRKHYNQGGALDALAGC
jgi:hypothetical protein